MHKPTHRKLRFEGLEERRLAAGINLQYTNLSSLKQTTSSQSGPVQQSSMTFKSSNTLTPGIAVNHSETFVIARRSRRR